MFTWTDNEDEEFITEE